jgi:hypothetical protein
MKYVELGSGAMIYIPGFIKTESRNSKVDMGDTQTHRENGVISLPLFFQNKESRLKKKQQNFFHKVLLSWM